MRQIAIIIVNYTGYAEKFLADCIASLRAQECPDWLWQLYLIDNCSSEQSVNYLKQQAPEAVIIPRADGNYAAANAVGVAQALKDGSEYFVIANMDVVFDSHWLEELVKMTQVEGIGIAQSKILLYGQDNKINSVGNIIHFLGFGYTRGYGEVDGGQYDDIKEINGYASGCSLIIKKEVMDKIGNYDREYYMYHDDLEFGWRAKLAGYKIAFAPQSIVYHKYEFSRSVRMLYYLERNRYLAIFSFYKLPTIILLLPALIAMEFGLLIYALAKGLLLIKIKIYWYWLRPSTWRHVSKVRRQVKKFRRLSEREIVRQMSGRIEYQEIMNPVLQYIVNPLFSLYWNIARFFIWW